MKYNKPTISAEYKQTLIDMHASRSWGTKGHKQAVFFLPFLRQLRCRTILDYGAGQGSLKRELGKTNLDLDILEYDPGVEYIAKQPVPAAFVVCGDVMEHVEEEYVDNVIEHIYLLAITGAYFNIATKEAKAILPDGRNAHITLYRADWWRDKLKRQPWTITKEEIGKKCAKFYVTK